MSMVALPTKAIIGTQTEYLWTTIHWPMNGKRKFNINSGLTVTCFKRTETSVTSIDMEVIMGQEADLAHKDNHCPDRP